MSSDVEADLGRLHEVDASESKQGDIPGGRATEDDELCLIQQVEHLQNRLARAEAQSDAYLRAQESRLEWEAHRQNSQLQAQVLALESEIQRMSFQRMRDENDLVAQDLGECDALRRTCDKLSSENASNSEIASQLAAIRSQLASSEEDRIRLRDSCLALEESAIRQAQDLDDLVAQMEDEIAKGRAAQARLSEAQNMIEWLKEERESIQQQLDAARVELARQTDKESYNVVELEKMILRLAEVRSEVSRHEAVQEQMKMEREEEGLELRTMLQRERTEKETLMKQRDDMLLQLNATTGIIETLRSQLAEAAVLLARNEEERRARLRSQQPRQFPAPEAGSSVDVKIEQQVSSDLPAELAKTKEECLKLRTEFECISRHAPSARLGDEQSKTLQEIFRVSEEMQQILPNLKRLENSLHKDLGSFASDMGPRALKLPPFPTAALAFRVQPEILMGKAAAANLAAHLSRASKSLESISQDMVAAPTDNCSLEAGKLDIEASRLEVLDALSPSGKALDAFSPFEKTIPPAPSASPSQDHPELHLALVSPASQRNMAVRADATASVQIPRLPVTSPDQESASTDQVSTSTVALASPGHLAEASTQRDRMPASQSPMQTLPSRFSKWAPSHDEHIDKLMHQGVEIDFTGDPLWASRENAHWTPRSVRDILACKPTKSCLSPSATRYAPRSPEKTSKRIQFAEKGNVLILLDPKEEETRGCGLEQLLGLASWQGNDISEDATTLEADVERHVRHNTETNAGSLFSFC